jgi:heme-degrading monooxygenase HmoA
MITVIFEVQPKSGKENDYFSEAAHLRDELEKIEGFISVERFESLATKGKYLSLSFWENEAAVLRWRNHPNHRHTQALGRNEIFQDYRLRVAGVIRDYGLNNRAQAPADSRQKLGI